MVIVTVWWQWCWPTPTWPVDANLLALIVMLLAAQWSFRYAIAHPGWRVKVWPILTGLGIVSLATAAAGRAGARDLPRTLLGAALWLTGVSAVTIHWLRHRRRPAPAPQPRPSDPDKL